MIHLIVGLVLLVLGAWGMIDWWDDFGEFLRGLVPIVLVLTGLAALGAGYQKTTAEAEPKEDETKPAESDDAEGQLT